MSCTRPHSTAGLSLRRAPARPLQGSCAFLNPHDELNVALEFSHLADGGEIELRPSDNARNTTRARASGRWGSRAAHLAIARPADAPRGNRGRITLRLGVLPRLHTDLGAALSISQILGVSGGRCLACYFAEPAVSEQVPVALAPLYDRRRLGCSERAPHVVAKPAQSRRCITNSTRIFARTMLQHPRMLRCRANNNPEG